MKVLGMIAPLSSAAAAGRRLATWGAVTKALLLAMGASLMLPLSATGQPVVSAGQFLNCEFDSSMQLICTGTIVIDDNATVGVTQACLQDNSCDYAAISSFSVSFTHTKTNNLFTESQGYTYTFSSNGKPAKAGLFANGDLWLAPADGETSVTIDSLTFSGTGDAVFVDDNPQPTSQGLLPDRDGKNYGSYNATETVTLPKTYSTATSVVAAIRAPTSWNCGTGFTGATSGNCVMSYNTVTVLPSVPPTFGKRLLRPAWSEATKELLNVDTDLDMSRWVTKNYFSGSDAGGYETIRRAWSHHSETLSLCTFEGAQFSEGGRAFRSELLADDYSAGATKIWYEHLFTAMSSGDSMAEKERALFAIITAAKDTFKGIYNCEDGTCQKVNGYCSGAGQWNGRGPQAALFASFAVDDKYAAAVRNEVNLAGVSPGTYQEIEQINAGINGPVWGDGEDDMTGGNAQDTVIRYWTELAGANCYDGATETCAIPGASQKTKRDPHGFIDGPPGTPGTLYMGVTRGPQQSFAALALVMPKFRETIATDLPITYAERIHEQGVLTGNDPCAPPDPAEIDGCDIDKTESTGHNCARWSMNSTTNIATYGPDPRDPTHRQCINNNTTCTRPDALSPWTCVASQSGDSNFGQNGRFTSRDGTAVENGAYWNAAVLNNFTTILNDAGYNQYP